MTHDNSGLLSAPSPLCSNKVATTNITVLLADFREYCYQCGTTVNYNHHQVPPHQTLYQLKTGRAKKVRDKGIIIINEL